MSEIVFLAGTEAANATNQYYALAKRFFTERDASIPVVAAAAWGRGDHAQDPDRALRLRRRAARDLPDRAGRAVRHPGLGRRPDPRGRLPAQEREGPAPARPDLVRALGQVRDRPDERSRL